MGDVREAGGEVITLRGITLRGRVTEADNTPLEGYRVEIWQCDMNGKYMHPGDRQSIDFDAAFQGFGHDITGADGSYSLRTIKPVTYPGRTPHIHVKVFDGETEILTSQFYIDGHPANGRDRIFNRLSEAQAKAVSMVFTPRPRWRTDRRRHRGVTLPDLAAHRPAAHLWPVKHIDPTARFSTKP